MYFKKILRADFEAS